MAACYFLHSFSGGAKSAEGPCEFDPPRQECTGKTSTGNTFACAAQRLGGGLNRVALASLCFASKPEIKEPAGGA